MIKVTDTIKLFVFLATLLLGAAHVHAQSIQTVFINGKICTIITYNTGTSSQTSTVDCTP